MNRTFTPETTVDDVLICPKCGSDAEIYDTDEIEFQNDNYGHYYVYCSCKICGSFKTYIKFKYQIVDVYN